MALGAIEQKKELIESRARIREFVFGIQDGLMSTVGLLAGVQGATQSSVVVIITGLTAMFSGAISMAAGSYLSSSAEKDIFDKELREAEVLAEKEPYLAAEELLKALNQEGLAREQSYNIVKVLLSEEQDFSGKFSALDQQKLTGRYRPRWSWPFPLWSVLLFLSFPICFFQVKGRYFFRLLCPVWRSSRWALSK